ncbi:MAG: hypothetical protein K8T90_01145 [Planctomycetes bacterium]|nr:hypothetical protein [Planctomycetota bacterium]
MSEIPSAASSGFPGPETRPSRLIEVVRRVALLAGLLGAIWCAMWPTRAMIRVHLVDFEKDPPRGWAFREDTLTVEERAAAEVADRLVHATGAAWTDLARAAEAASEGKDPGGVYSARLDTGWLPTRLWFRIDEEPVAAAAREMSSEKSFVYVPIAGETLRFLGLTWTTPMWAREAPGWIEYPLRRFAVWLALAGILTYVFLPRPRFAPGSVHTKRFRGTILPDILGAMLTCVFFALPVLVVPANSPDGDWTGGGWIVLWCIGFFMALFGVAINAVAAWMAVYRLDVLPDRVRRSTLFGDAEMRIADIASVRLRDRKKSKTLIVAGTLLSFANWRAAGPTLLYASRRDRVIEMIPRAGSGANGGKPFAVDPDHSEHLDGLLETLQRAGIPFEDTTAS